MYAALWRVLPGPWPLRLLACLALVIAVLAVCVRWLFPAVAEHLPVNDAELGSRAAVPVLAVTGPAATDLAVTDPAMTDPAVTPLLAPTRPDPTLERS